MIDENDKESVSEMISNIFIFVLLTVFFAFGNCEAVYNNKVFYDKFDTTLGDWTLDQSGGTVSIVVKDTSNQMKLHDTGAGIVSATRSFTQPSGVWILEYEVMFTSGLPVIMELLTSGDAALITFDWGSTANTVSFSTDSASATTSIIPATWDSGTTYTQNDIVSYNGALDIALQSSNLNHLPTDASWWSVSSTYKQVVIVVDSTAKTAKAFISDGDGINQAFGRGLIQIGGTKSYSNNTVAKVRFKTGAAASGDTYIDEVRVYTPRLFLYGDSRTDGKMDWSQQPVYRHGHGLAIENTNPQYVLEQLFGGMDVIANRSYGGADTATLGTTANQDVLYHSPAAILISIGHNDLADYGGRDAATTEGYYTPLLGLIRPYVSGSNLILANVFCSTSITGARITEKNNFNAWLRDTAYSIGATYVDLNSAMCTGDAITSAYDYGDGVHLNPTGTAKMMQAVWDVFNTRVLLNRAGVLKPATFGDRLYPAGYVGTRGFSSVVN